MVPLSSQAHEGYSESESDLTIVEIFEENQNQEMEKPE